LEPLERASFVGSVSTESFHLRRIIGYQNSFLPTIRGRIEQGVPGSVISIRMHIHPVVGVFMAIWLSLTGNGALASLKSGIGFEAGMFAFGVLIVCAGFYPEAIAASRTLRRVLGAV
jgi:hypothetical protein